MLVDADGHVTEPADVWVDRMDRAKWGDLIPHYLAEATDGNPSLTLTLGPVDPIDAVRDPGFVLNCHRASQ